MVSLFFSLNAFGQLTKENEARIKTYGDSLRVLSDIVMEADSDLYRAKACYGMIPKLVQALKVPGSFYYHFDSLQRISILYPDDSSFRIFNWFLPRGDGSYRYFGAIQKKSEKLALIPLFDRSDSIDFPVDTVLNNNTWFGALYYRIYETKIKGKPYYTLFGWDGNDLMSTKKLIDVLYFDDAGNPKFGAPIFSFGDEQKSKHVKRFILEFTKEASITLNYDDDRKMIVFDHLTSSNEKTADLPFTYVPDGSYDGFKWDKDHWAFVDNVFKDIIDDKKQTPVPMPVGSHNMMQPGPKK